PVRGGSRSVTPAPPFDLRRALRYVAAATALGVVVGAFREGSLVGGLLFGLIVGVGVAGGLVLYEIAMRNWRP
ncbi:hypothetical protein ACFQE1_19975, partial [Halobium palmae]